MVEWERGAPSEPGGAGGTGRSLCVPAFASAGPAGKKCVVGPATILAAQRLNPPSLGELGLTLVSTSAPSPGQDCPEAHA